MLAQKECACLHDELGGIHRLTVLLQIHRKWTAASVTVTTRSSRSAMYAWIGRTVHNHANCVPRSVLGAASMTFWHRLRRRATTKLSPSSRATVASVQWNSSCVL